MIKPLSIEANKVIYKCFSRSSPILAEIILHWEKIIGTEFNIIVSPVKVISTREASVKTYILYIKVKNSSIGMELSYRKDIILQRISLYLGREIINKIIILSQ